MWRPGCDGFSTRCEEHIPYIICEKGLCLMAFWIVCAALACIVLAQYVLLTFLHIVGVYSPDQRIENRTVHVDAHFSACLYLSCIAIDRLALTDPGSRKHLLIITSNKHNCSKSPSTIDSHTTM